MRTILQAWQDNPTHQLKFVVVSHLIPSPGLPLMIALNIDGTIQVFVDSLLMPTLGSWSSPAATIIEVSFGIKYTVAAPQRRMVQHQFFDERMFMVANSNMFISASKGYSFMLTPWIDCKVEPSWEDTDLWLGIHGGT